jgi:hypothetical protein
MKKAKKNLILMAIGCVIAFTAISQSIQTGSLAQQLIGEWRNIYLKAIIHHPNKSPVTMEADSTNWEANIGIKPIRTYFKQDGSYYSEYRNLKDSIIRKASGLWSIKGDSIIMNEQSPEKSTLRLQVKIDKDVATFSGIIDLEGDGIADDEYYGKQRKFK